jgi:hypothetical protein
MAFERPEHEIGAEPKWGIEGQMVQCQMKVRSKVRIEEMVMMMVRWFHLAFLLLKQVDLWWQG